MIDRRWLHAAMLAMCLVTASPRTGSARGLGDPVPATKIAAEAVSIVPADAVAFGRVRLADLWKSEAMKDFREVLSKAGEKAIAAFDARFVPTPSSMNHVTVFAVKREEEVYPYVVFALTKPVDRPEFLKSLGANSETKLANGTMFVVEGSDTAFWFVDPSTFGIGSVESVKYLLSREAPKARGVIDAARVLTADKPIAFALDGALLTQVEQQLSPEFRPLARMKSLVVTADIVGNGHIGLRMDYGTEKARIAAENAIEQLKEMAKAGLAQSRKELSAQVFGDGKTAPVEQMGPAAAALLGLAMTQYAEDALKDLPIEKNGSALVLNVALPKGGPMVVAGVAVPIGLLLPAVQKVREAASRTQDSNNLKQLGLAMHGYHDSFGKLPAAAICDKQGKPLLSWRVAVLPFIEQDNLYKQFKLDEPWDSDHNKKLIPLMPKTLMSPLSPQQTGMTHYVVLTGKSAMFSVTEGRLLASITDGTSNTAMIVEAAQPVEWTRPQDLVYDDRKPVPKLLSGPNGGSNVAMGDGSVRFLRTVGIDEKVLRAMMTANGGEVLNSKE